MSFFDSFVCVGASVDQVDLLAGRDRGRQLVAHLEINKKNIINLSKTDWLIKNDTVKLEDDSEVLVPDEVDRKSCPDLAFVHSELPASNVEHFRV